MLIAGLLILVFFLACAASVVAIGVRNMPRPVTTTGHAPARPRLVRVKPLGVKSPPETWMQLHGRAFVALRAAGFTRTEVGAVLRQRPKRIRRRATVLAGAAHD